MANALPTIPKIASTTFRLNRVQASNPSRGGQFQGVDLAEPLWSAQIQTTALTRAQAGQYDALFAKSRGVLRTIYVYDAKRQRPLAYVGVANNANARIGATTRKIGSTTLKIGRAESPWGEPRVSAVSRANGTLTVTGCSPGATWSEGDYVAWNDGPARRLHIVTEPATADASGNVTLTVEPQPPTTATATLPTALTAEKASAEMVIVQHDHPWRVGQASAASFSASQVLRRY